MKKEGIAILILLVALIVSMAFNFVQMSGETKISEKTSETAPVLVEAMFVNYYMSAAQSRGVLIFKNIGLTTYDSNKFKLYLNDAVQDDNGCEKPGTIAPDDLCSLIFKKVCQPGDTLSVKYDGITIMTKDC